ncbi:MAG: hypothetical protein QOI45_2370 [Thermoleophilaceae bacterium]|jgi:hypothetical protein|nr:hypothetical protein [Thermoleophilaceae bacterium]
MPSMVILRVKNPGVETSRLLARLEAELGVGAQPQTAGYVPISLDGLDAEAARARVIEVLDGAASDWPEHLELRS